MNSRLSSLRSDPDIMTENRHALVDSWVDEVLAYALQDEEEFDEDEDEDFWDEEEEEDERPDEEDEEEFEEPDEEAWRVEPGGHARAGAGSAG